MLDNTTPDTDDEGIETVDNPQRGCGTLAEGKAYLRSELSAHGVLPPVVEFEEPIMWLEGQLRGYKRFPGLQFEIRQAPSAADYLDEAYADDTPDDERQSIVDAVNMATAPTAVRDHEGALDTLRTSRPAGEWLFRADPPLEVERHVKRLQNDVDRDGPFVDHVGEMRVARAHDMLIWVGESYYDTPESFLTECREHGLSKAIPVSKNQEPPVINPGRTRLFLIHPHAVETGHDPDTGEPTFEPGIIGYAYVTRVIYTGADTGDGDVDFPEWAQEQADADRMDLVEVGEPESAEAVENGSTLADWAVDEAGGDDSAPSREDVEAIPHQKLRTVAADHDLDVSQNPSKDELVDAVLDAGLVSSVGGDGGDGQ